MKNILFVALIGLIAFSGCNQIKPVKTVEDLKASVKGETNASIRYAAFAQKARQEKHESIAMLFDAAAKAESIHATNHLKVLESLGEKMEDFKPEYDVRTTAENLQAAIDGETYESTTMYPQFLLDAKAEKVSKATRSFNWAADTEKKHQQLYAAALESLKNNTEKSLPAKYAVCPVCGNTYKIDSMDDQCAFCKTKKEKFIVE